MWLAVVSWCEKAENDRLVYKIMPVTASRIEDQRRKIREHAENLRTRALQHREDRNDVTGGLVES
jgi:hypothetical protein